VRLRADHYPDASRAGWKALLEREAGRRDIFAIARHAGLPADDPNAGLGFARWLAGSPPSG